MSSRPRRYSLSQYPNYQGTTKHGGQSETRYLGFRPFLRFCLLPDPAELAKRSTLDELRPHMVIDLSVSRCLALVIWEFFLDDKYLLLLPVLASPTWARWKTPPGFLTILGMEQADSRLIHILTELISCFARVRLIPTSSSSAAAGLRHIHDLCYLDRLPGLHPRLVHCLN